MKFALGFAAGLTVAWAALAIWQRVPPLGPIDPGDEPVYSEALTRDVMRLADRGVPLSHP